MKLPLDGVDHSWLTLFHEEQSHLESILDSINQVDYLPGFAQIFRAFEQPLPEIKVVIFGQDPYPGEGVADGLAFSSQAGNPIPASLRNIFKELVSDLEIPTPASADLSKWAQSGVMLLNRSLTTATGERKAHHAYGWSDFTQKVAQILAKRDVVAILWGNNARELAPLFKYRIESAHPSPLSAHRGFFGSRPFSRANEMLIELDREPVNWSL